MNKEEREKKWKEVVKLRNLGYRLKDIALELDIGIATVNRALKKYGLSKEQSAGPVNHFANLISQACIDLKHGKTAYCFTHEHIRFIKRKCEVDFTATPNGVGYTLIPSKK